MSDFNTPPAEEVHLDQGDEQRMHRRALLKVAAASSLATGVVGAGALRERVAAQATPTAHVFDAAFTTRMLVQVGEVASFISVETDAAFVEFTQGDPEQTEALAHHAASDAIQLHRIFGLSLDGIQRVTISQDKPPDAPELFTLNEEVIAARKLSALNQTIQGYLAWCCIIYSDGSFYCFLCEIIITYPAVFA